MKIETKCLHAGYTPKNTEPRVVPIVQSTTYVYDSTDDVAAVFDDPTKSLIYSRFENPTVMAVEEKINALEGGVGAMCTSSGQAASLLSLLNILKAGDSFKFTVKFPNGVQTNPLLWYLDGKQTSSTVTLTEGWHTIAVTINYKDGRVEKLETEFEVK